jgi:hypothetical protein
VAAESIPIYSLAKGLIRYVPSFLLKRHFTAERLANLVYFDLAPRGETAHINVGQVASANLYVQVINLAPFPIELDRAQLDMNCCGGRVDFVHLTRLTLQSGGISQIALQSAITDGSATAIANSTETSPRAWLNGTVEFNCGFRNFSKRIGLSDIRPVVINANTRKAAA